MSEPREYLRHILAEAEYLPEHSRGRDQASFLAPSRIGKHGIDVIAPTRFRSSIRRCNGRAVLRAGLEAPHDPDSKIPSRVEVSAVRQSGR